MTFKFRGFCALSTERPDVHHASPDTAADLIEDASAYQVGDDPTRSVFSYFEEIFHALHRHLGCRVMDDVIDHRSEHFCAASLVAPINAHSLVGRKRSTTSTLFMIARTYTNAGVVSLDAPRTDLPSIRHDRCSH